MDNVSVSRTEPIGDGSGSLYVLEKQSKLPFEIKRIYYITDVASCSVIRGNHAHKQLRQLLFCVGGSCEITLDNGVDRMTVILDDPGKILYIRPCLWREISKFSKNATLIVLASDEYNEQDYIRDYEEFKEYVRK